MLSEDTSGKIRIKAAKQMAKEHGVDVLGWNEKPGKEFISFNGQQDKLQAVKKAMESDGWLLWPVDEEHEENFMDFGMKPPPGGIERSGIATVADTQTPMYGEPYFRYSGPTSLFFANLTFVILFTMIIILASKHLFLEGDIILRSLLCGSLALIIIGLLLLLCWISVYADNSILMIRKYCFGKVEEIPLSNIKTIRIYTQTSRRGATTKFIAINLKSGKPFDVFLPKQKQIELVAFIKGKIS